MTTNKIRAFVACVGLLAVSMSAVQAAPDKTVSVNVVNSEENPVPVQLIDQKARTPFQGAMRFTRDTDGNWTITPLDPTPAADMILTIENLSGLCQVSEEAKMFVPKVTTTFQEKEVKHYLIPVLLSTPTNTDYRLMNYAFNHTTTIFADTNAPIDPSATLIYVGADDPFLSCSFTVSGFLENLN